MEHETAYIAQHVNELCSRAMNERGKRQENETKKYVCAYTEKILPKNERLYVCVKA